MSSTSTPTMQEWLVIIPDVANSNRLAVRAKHFENLQGLIASKTIVMGGATLKNQPDENGKVEMTGSALLVHAESREKLIELLKKDPYVEGGAWDLDNASIYPFKCATRSPM